ncbi:hypothetical protein LGK95_13145 [Clostridium algoriphilum]|uniref:hypothetical protein n=1 Tax=Clostridium algoriphilum TaxID=198347 RepID=UPI001CF5BA3D|nr:hypothetical protein [Clostridium algoriphilum]MCB2294456.1 hypothetical protein [Clostridium algoriphilum]
MKNKSLKIKILTGLITGGMLLSPISTTFAATAKTSATHRKEPSKLECKQTDIKRQQGLDSNLKKLITSKTLTQDQANKVKSAITKAQSLKKADFKKIKTMTKEQRKTYMNSKRINHVNPLKSLVDNGTITQAQANKIGITCHGGHQGSGNHKHKSS